MISQVNVYVVDIVWILRDAYMCGGQNSSWFSEASLRICYVSLFECKGPNAKNCYKLPFVEQRITKLD